MKFNWVLAGAFLVLLFLFIPFNLALVIWKPINLENERPYLQVYEQVMITLLPGLVVLGRRAQLGCGYWLGAAALLLLDAFFIWLLYVPATNSTPWLFQGL